MTAHSKQHPSQFHLQNADELEDASWTLCTVPRDEKSINKLKLMKKLFSRDRWSTNQIEQTRCISCARVWNMKDPRSSRAHVGFHCKITVSMIITAIARYHFVSLQRVTMRKLLHCIQTSGGGTILQMPNAIAASEKLSQFVKIIPWQTLFADRCNVRQRILKFSALNINIIRDNENAQ